MQASLFADCEPKAVRPKPRRKTAAQRQRDNEQAFRQFDSDNPHIFLALKEMALALKRAGHERWGMRNLYEKLRYDLAMKSTETAPTLNNCHAPFYARKLMADFEELREFFEVRERR